ncbi:hypothetical protein FVF58_09390 [Paraburkholderia panacisoli]|uniref:Uncharacterized protein n=1 Tax=Paraburkholderia panacisoli TaxID=2603818 RepID=A0A5B0HCK4_9BURK|nr:hypothetical protein [Paraburkholderia panacisoli]KAA1012995.1 hypothetical protein FVF58_09390 [Paraburkholderia panacisoli]
MAGDWIKMRVSLTRDPRVIRMADWLAGQADFVSWLTVPAKESSVTSAYGHVTRHVTVALCVTALLVTWGTAREQGDRDGDDLILSQCDLDTISAMSDLPCFGPAMSLVGWARLTEDGSVMFPKFFRENETPDEKHKRQAAERQARKREKDRFEAEEKSRNSNVTSNVTDSVTDDVTVTHREEKRREEKRETKAETRRATRLPADWEPSDIDIEFCQVERPDLDVESVAAQFRDFWIAKGGKDGAKLDWPATWRNWVRNQRGGKPSGQQGNTTGLVL